MKRFGTVDTFIESSEASLKIGRLVANFEFLKALLTHGTFDEFHLFCPNQESRRLLDQRLASFLDEGARKRVILSHHLQVTEALSQLEFHAFHLGDWHTYLPKLAVIRARHAAHPFPLSGPIHSLDGVGTLDHVADLLRSPLRPGDAVVCTSHPGQAVFRNMMTAVKGQAGWPQAAPSPRTAVIPLAVEPPRTRDRASGRALFGMSDQGVGFLYIGRISMVSKADLGPLLYAFRILAEHQRDDVPVRLVIAGTGGQADWGHLLSQIRDLGLEGLVELRSGIEDAEKELLLAGADVFVSPVDSLQETFGLSVLEAMAAGLPVIASDFDGYRDLVVDGETGFLVPTLWGRPPERLLELSGILEYRTLSLALCQTLAVDLEALLARMVLLVRNPGLRASMGASGQARVESHFTWAKVIPQYEVLWDDLKREARDAGLLQPCAPPLSAGVFEMFRDYPTALLDDAWILGLSGIAHAVLQGALPMPPSLEELTVLAPLDSLRPIVEALSAGPRPWGEVRAEVAGTPKDILDFQAMWMFKHGLLTRSGTASPGR